MPSCPIMPVGGSKIIPLSVSSSTSYLLWASCEVSSNVKIVHEKHYIKSTTPTKKQNEGQLRVTIVFQLRNSGQVSTGEVMTERGEPGQKELTLLKWYPEAREIWSCKSPLRASTGLMRMTWVSDESRWRSLRGPVGAAGVGGWTPFNSKVSNLGPPCAWRSSTLMRLLLVSATYSFPTVDAQQRSTPNVRHKEKPSKLNTSQILLSILIHESAKSVVVSYPWYGKILMDDHSATNKPCKDKSVTFAALKLPS